jgi:hypothetical protein
VRARACVRGWQERTTNNRIATKSGPVVLGIAVLCQEALDRADDTIGSDARACCCVGGECALLRRFPTAKFAMDTVYYMACSRDTRSSKVLYMLIAPPYCAVCLVVLIE